MKKLSTFLIGLLFVNLNLNAQNTCLGAQVITESGTFTVSAFSSSEYPPNAYCTSSSGALWGARWYVYQPMIDGLATVTSDLTANGDVDTRLTVYTGNCVPLENLTCIVGNDDIDSPNNQYSEVSFAVSSGSSYYIVWDNANYPPPFNTHPSFNFSLTETAVDCAAIGLPIIEDFDDYNSYVACLTTESADANFTSFEQSSFDWGNDGSIEDYVNNGSISTIAKDDWIFSTPINLISGHDYTITFKYNGADGSFPANENLDVYFMEGPSSGATSLVNLFSASGIQKNGTNQQVESMATNQSIDYTSTVSGTFYLAFNGTSPANTGSLLLFEYSVTDNTLGVSDFTSNGLSKYYNKQTDVLTLNSNSMVFDRIEIYNILGQEVYKKSSSKQKEHINLSGLFDGIYIVRVSSGDQTYTTKLLKQ